MGRPIDEMEKLERKLKKAKAEKNPQLRVKIIQELRTDLRLMIQCAEVQRMLHSCDCIEKEATAQNDRLHTTVA